MKKRKELYTAVVMALSDISDVIPSARDNGSWSCVVGENKDAVITEAIRLKRKWEASGVYGPYEILIGRLTEKATLPMAFKIVKV